MLLCKRFALRIFSERRKFLSPAFRLFVIATMSNDDTLAIAIRFDDHDAFRFCFLANNRS